MSEVIVITSGKGGVGKTTTTANIGTGLAQLNKKVVMIDTDIGLRNLDVVMGLENRIVYNLVDVIEGKCRIRQALIKDKRYPELCLLPSAQTRDKDAVTPEQMVALINELREEFDYILLDCPAGIEQGFKNAVAGADRALVVTTPEVSAIRDADRIVGLLEANEMKRIDLIVNRLRVDMVKRGEMMTVDDVTDILAVNLLGAVPDDEQIVISTNRGEPLVGTNCLAGKAYSNICHRIMGEEVPFLNLNEKQGVLEKLKDIFKKKTSGNVAKDRLKLVLVSDRANCSSEMMEMMKNDIIEVISRYMDIDAEALDVKITETESDSNNGTVPALVANIPIRDMKHRPDPR